MNKLEMARELFNNPKLKAKKRGDLTVGCRVGDNGREIVWEEGFLKGKVVGLVICGGDEWEIISPKIKEFDFGEVFHIFNTTNISANALKSVVSGLSYSRVESEITLEEYMGKWTIEGYYDNI